MEVNEEPINDKDVEEPTEVPTGEDQSKSVKAFVEDDKIEEFGREFRPLFSKHIILSFLNKEDVALLMTQFDNALLSQMAFRKLSEEDLLKYSLLRMVFFSTVRRAVGRGTENERTLLSKTISESIIAQQHSPSFMDRFFKGKR